MYRTLWGENDPGTKVSTHGARSLPGSDRHASVDLEVARDGNIEIALIYRLSSGFQVLINVNSHFHPEVKDAAICF